MIIPVRCFTCNKVLGSLYQKYKQMKNESDSSDDVIDQDEIIDESGTLTPAIQKNIDIFKKLKIKRYCCKRHLISHVDLLVKI